MTVAEDGEIPEKPIGRLFPIGGEIDRIRVSIRVGGDDLEPDQVTRLLGVSPTFAASKGQRRIVAGRELKQRTGVWGRDFSGAPDEWTLEDAIVELLRQFPVDLDVWGTLAQKYSLEVFCGLFLRAPNRGFSLRPEILRMLSDRHLKLGVDIYAISNADPSGEEG